jgi:outer membrane protein TolC/ABC-type uncharacterized transport system substrate-binding protein
MKRMLILAVVLALACASGAFGAREKRSVRVAYFEGGNYFLHKATMSELRSALENMAGDSVEIIYLPDAYFTAGWNRDVCRAMSHDLIRNKNVDLVIAAGPWAIEDLLEANFDRPIVGICQFDPIAMGLLDSAGRPTAENLTVNYAPDKIKNDMAAMQKLFPSQNIGLLYFESGDEMEKIRAQLSAEAAKYGAAVYAGDAKSDKGTYSFFKSFAQIRNKIDILYLPPLWGLELDQIRNFIWETQNAKIPVFASEGILIVEKEASASGCFRPYRSMARFTAYKIIKIISGASPASLPTAFEEHPELCINLESCSKLGRKFSDDRLIGVKTIPQRLGDDVTVYKLSAAIAQALRENPGFQAKKFAYDKAVALARDKYRDFYPSLEAEISAAATDENSLASDYEPFYHHEWQAGANLEQSIFSYQAIKSIGIARKNIDLQKADLKKSEADLKLSTTIAYLSILANEERLAAIEEMLDRARIIRDDVDANRRMGLSVPDDSAFVERHLAELWQRQLEIKAELTISRVVFNALVNRPVDEKFALDKSDFDVKITAELVRKLKSYLADPSKEYKFEQKLLELGVERSPAMKKSEHSIGIQKELLSIHKKRFLPEIDFLARYSYADAFGYSERDPHDYWLVGGRIRWPLFNGKRETGNGRALRADLDRLEYQKDSLRFDLVKDISTLFIRLKRYAGGLPLIYQSRSGALANLETIRNRYNNNEDASIFDLLKTAEMSESTIFDSIKMRFGLFEDYARLLNMLGYDYPDNAIPENAPFFKAMGE